MATTPTTIKRSCYYFPNIWQPESRISLQYAGDRDLIKSLLTIHQVLDRLINMADNHDQLPQMVNLSLGEDRETSDLSVCSPSEVLERETSLDPATAYFLSLVQSPYSCTETTVIRQKMDLITVCMESDIETYEVAHNNVHTHEAAIRNLEANGDPLGCTDSVSTLVDHIKQKVANRVSSSHRDRTRQSADVLGENAGELREIKGMGEIEENSQGRVVPKHCGRTRAYY